MTALVLVQPQSAQLARATIAHHSKSFALASRLLGPRLRDQTAVVYAWCRRADDAVDEHPGDHQTTLADLDDELAAAYAGVASEPVLAAFGEVVRARRIPIAYPRELLAGMAMDAAGMRYTTHAELITYAYRVAGVVGLMMSHVFGIARDAALVHAAHLGIAMQLTNICRDVAEDWQRGRLYIPDELLAAHGAAGLADDLGEPLPATAHAALAASIRDLLALADRYYRSGDRGMTALPWRAAVAVRAARSIYSSIGREIARRDHDVTAGRAFVSTSRKLWLAVAAMRPSLPRSYAIPSRTLELADVTEP